VLVPSVADIRQEMMKFLLHCNVLQLSRWLPTSRVSLKTQSLGHSGYVTPATLVAIRLAARRHVMEDLCLHTHRCENSSAQSWHNALGLTSCSNEISELHKGKTCEFARVSLHSQTNYEYAHDLTKYKCNEQSVSYSITTSQFRSIYHNYFHSRTDKICLRGNAADLFSGGVRFASRPQHRQSWHMFFIFSSVSKQMLEQYLKLRHDSFLPYPFEFIIRHYLVSAIDTG
jgi:hypothetical protein